MRRLLFTTCCFLFAASGYAQTIRGWTDSQQSKLLSEFEQFLSIPNVAADTPGLRRTADFILGMMERRGIGNRQLLHGRTPGIAPAVYGEVMVPGATRTLVFYAHYDGQPVNPAQWTTGSDPFTPVLFQGSMAEGAKMMDAQLRGGFLNDEYRIYARSASDDKAGIMAILTAYEALVKNGRQPACNLKFFFEGEEEAGSPHLQEILEVNKDLLRSDLWIICDGPVHQSGRKQIVFGVRGDTHLYLTMYGPKRPLHSGHYGNWAPNPAMELVQLLATMKDKAGRVTIKDFYKDVTPLTATEKKALREVPSVDAQMRKELGLGASEMNGLSLVEAINQPSLNINGISSGNVGKLASNQIPTQASAVLDLRLVLGNDWRRQQDKVIAHIKAQGYTVIDHEPGDEERQKHTKLVRVDRDLASYNAQRTPMDDPLAQDVIRAVQATTSDKLVLQPTMGGSLPLFVFQTVLGAKTITVPIANHDNNQHAENENIRLGNLWSGIETMASLMVGSR
jgi:acetylornithine deacetylase/succinyl-diaminopimelate desuccinylase-like protein